MQQLYSAYRPEKLTYEALDEDTLRDQIAAWLRPSYDSAIAARRDQTAAYRAELDADAIARGMGSSTYVTDVKSRQLADEAEDIATLEGEYGAQLGKLTMEAAEAERERELEVAIENQKQDQAAYMEAYQAALGLFDTYLKSRGGGRSKSSAAADVSGTTKRKLRAVSRGADRRGTLRRVHRHRRAEHALPQRADRLRRVRRVPDADDALSVLGLSGTAPGGGRAPARPARPPVRDAAAQNRRLFLHFDGSCDMINRNHLRRTCAGEREAR